MTSDALLRIILAAFDDVGRVFDHNDLAEWPQGSLETLLSIGLVRQSASGLTAPCPSCSEPHTEVVARRAGHDGTTRLFIWCPEQLRVEVTPEMCRGWEPDLDGLARAVGNCLGVKGANATVVPGRLWRLGRVPWEGKTREVLFAVRLNDRDGTSVAAHVGVGGRSVVVVPYQVPDERVWPGRVPAVVSLERVAALGSGELTVDGVAFMQIIAEADAVAAERGELPQEHLAAKKVRRHVKETIDSMVSNEALVQAYRVHGSYRKTADALNAEGFITDRWAVERAVKAAGGPEAVRRAEDSDSVSRTVASQPRDRAQKIAQRR